MSARRSRVSSKKVHVEIGDRVQKGDLLAEIDPTVFETRTRTDRANLENLRAQFNEQEANLVLARQQLQRNQNLFKAKIVSQDTLQTSEAQLAAGEAKADSLKAQIDGAQATLDGDVANLGYTKIYAPMGGTIVSQTALEGQTLNANQSAPVIVRVADLDTMTVWAQVAEADVVKLTPGMPAYFSTLGLPDRRWQGTVQQIQPTPQTVNDVVLYNVLIDVKNDDHVLMTSMTAQVFFILGEAKGVPLVPVTALGQPRAGAADEYEVRVLTSEGPRRRTVKIGLADRTSAQVLSGLAVGDQVIVGRARRRRQRGAVGRRRALARPLRVPPVTQLKPKPAPALLALDGVSKVYRNGTAEIRALDSVSLEIRAGEFVAIMGQSGSGKSTLMNIIGCLDRPSRGSYQVGGRDVADLSADELAALRRDTFGFVFQRYNLLATATAAENVEIPAIYAGRSWRERTARAQALLQRLGLGDRARHIDPASSRAGNSSAYPSRAR